MNEGHPHYRLAALLDREFGLTAQRIKAQPRGWAALAFRVETGSRPVFLKVYDKRWASTARWTQTIDVYIPLLRWMQEFPLLKNRVPQPILTRDGKPKVEDSHAIYLLYEFIEGQTIGDAPLRPSHLQTLAAITAALHDLPLAQLPLRAQALALSFQVPYARHFRELLARFSTTLPADLTDCFAPHSERILRLGDWVEEEGEAIERLELPAVLCHTDIHPWNLMVTSSGLMLIDWEGLALAPIEADFMALAGRPDFPAFWTVYRRNRRTRPGTELHPKALRYFQARRVLEDTWELVERIAYDEPTGSARTKLLSDLHQTLSELPPIPESQRR